MAEAVVTETPAVPAASDAKPAPVAELESVKAFRERRAEVADLAEGDPAPDPAAAKPAEAEPDPASDAGKELAKKRGSLQARIDEITREKGESERALQARIAALEAGLAKGKPAQPAAEPAGDPKAALGGKETAKQAWERLKTLPDAPKASDFSSYDDYQFASAVFVNEKLTEERQAAAVTQSRATAFNQARDRVEQAAKKEFADFDTVVDSFVKAGGRYSPPAAEAIFNHPEGHRLAYALAKDPALNARLSAINHPVQFGIELAAVLASLPKSAGSGQTAAAAAAVPVVPVSKAPEPVPGDTGGASPAAVPNPDNIVSVKEWRKQRGRFADAA